MERNGKIPDGLLDTLGILFSGAVEEAVEQVHTKVNEDLDKAREHVDDLPAQISGRLRKFLRALNVAGSAVERDPLEIFLDLVESEDPERGQTFVEFVRKFEEVDRERANFERKARRLDRLEAYMDSREERKWRDDVGDDYFGGYDEGEEDDGSGDRTIGKKKGEGKAGGKREGEKKESPESVIGRLEGELARIKELVSAKEKEILEIKKQLEETRRLLGSAETRATLAERADSVFPELNSVMQAVLTAQGKLKKVFEGVVKAKEGNNPLGFFEWSQISECLDESSLLLRKIEDRLVCDFDLYQECVKCFEDVFAEVAANEGFPTATLFSKVFYLKGLVNGLLSLQNQIQREKVAAEHENEKKDRNFEDKQDLWTWHDPEKNEDYLIDYFDLLSLGLMGGEDKSAFAERIKNLVKNLEEVAEHSEEQKILRELGQIFRRASWHINSHRFVTLPEYEEIREDADRLQGNLARFYREVLENPKVFFAYFELYEANIDDLVSWRQMYPRLAEVVEKMRSGNASDEIKEE